MGEKEGDMMPERIFSYGDDHFTLNELLEKPEVLSYLIKAKWCRKGQESSS